MICIYIYIYMYVGVSIRIYAYIYVYIYIHIYANAAHAETCADHTDKQSIYLYMEIMNKISTHKIKHTFSWESWGNQMSLRSFCSWHIVLKMGRSEKVWTPSNIPNTSMSQIILLGTNDISQKQGQTCGHTSCEYSARIQSLPSAMQCNRSICVQCLAVLVVPVRIYIYIYIHIYIYKYICIYIYIYVKHSVCILPKR